MSNIEPLPDIHWSVKAALVDMLDNVDDVEGFILIWVDKNDNKQYSQSAKLTNKDALWALEVERCRLMNE